MFSRPVFISEIETDIRHLVSRVAGYLHCAKNNLNLCIKAKPVTAEEDVTIHFWVFLLVVLITNMKYLFVVVTVLAVVLAVVVSVVVVVVVVVVFCCCCCCCFCF